MVNKNSTYFRLNIEFMFYFGISKTVLIYFRGSEECKMIDTTLKGGLINNFAIR